MYGFAQLVTSLEGLKKHRERIERLCWTLYKIQEMADKIKEWLTDAAARTVAKPIMKLINSMMGRRVARQNRKRRDGNRKRRRKC